MPNEELTNGTGDRDMIVALAHVTGFAKACERKSNAEIFRMLEQFYEVVGAIVDSVGGTVVKFMGDAAFLIFSVDQPTSAVDALRDLRKQTQPLWTTFDDSCHVHTKAHLGPVRSGELGVSGDKRFDVIGNTVNQLVRMPEGKLELSPELRDRLGSGSGPTESAI
jgi:class 3 adenylate cyclase